MGRGYVDRLEDSRLVKVVAQKLKDAEMLGGGKSIARYC